MKSEQEIEQKNELLNKKRQNLSSKNNSEYQSIENKKKKIDDNKKQKNFRIFITYIINWCFIEFDYFR